jgi:tetratricopeptide (TPR) repeat protein
LVVWGLFALAILSKPMAVSLPFVMLVIDYYPLRRHEQLGWGRLLWEKAGPIALAASVAIAVMITESRKGGLMLPLETVPLSQRVLLMFQSLIFYPCKLVWPVRLSPFYPLGASLSLDQLPVLLSVLCVGIITILAVRERLRLPALAAGCGAYVILVLPVSGLMQTGGQAVADRYVYQAMIPLLLLAAGGLVWLWRHSVPVTRVGLTGLLACELCVYGSRTRNVIPTYHDAETLWRTVLAQFPDSRIANRSLLLMFVYQGRTREALDYAQRNVEIAPQMVESHNNLGVVLARLDRLPDAVEQYEQALRIAPDSIEVLDNLGITLLRMDKVQEAIGVYEHELRTNPDYVEAHVNLGSALLRLGKVQEAVGQYEQALRINPDYAEAHGNLGAIYQRMGKLPEAVAQYEQALRSKPDYVEAHFNLGLALEKIGRAPEAIEHYEQALKLRPDYAPARNALARLGAGH